MRIGPSDRVTNRIQIPAVLYLSEGQEPSLSPAFSANNPEMANAQFPCERDSHSVARERRILED